MSFCKRSDYTGSDKKTRIFARVLRHVRTIATPRGGRIGMQTNGTSFSTPNRPTVLGSSIAGIP